jgi:hypothetical protein
MDNETQNEDAFVDTDEASEELEIELDDEPEEEKITMTKSEWEKFQQTQGSLKRQVKELRKSGETKATQNTANELNDAQLNYLDVKGVYEPEDISIVETFVQKTGKTVREALRDDYVTSKLQSNKTAREVQEAMPSGSKRGGNSGNDLASAIAKYEATGTLPTDFGMRSAVINAFVDKGHKNKPSWQS